MAPAPKKKKAGKKKKKAAESPRFSLTPSGLLKWATVAGIWAVIALSIVVGWYASELPKVLESADFERRAAITVKAADGTVLKRYGDLVGVSVTVGDLPPHLINAVLATEDRRFYKHHGIDPVGIARAMFINARAGRFVQGGSTITQQLAKNLFLSHERTLKRKIQEALLALWLEQRLDKDQILGAYLNRVYLGSGAYGVDAASHVYFNKPARDVNLREAAILAGLLKAPSRYAPDSNPGLAAQRAKVVLGAMREAGYITEDEWKKETLNTPAPQRKPTESGGVYYFTDWIASELHDLIGTPDRDLTVETTLDPAIQKQAEEILSRYLRENGEEKHVAQGAVMVMTLDGAIVAMVGGRDHQASKFNRATQAMRAPGSAFKPVVFLTALQQGWKPRDLIDDSPITQGKYRPSNFGNENHGEVPLENALALSMNAATVRLAQQVGIGPVINTARALGIRAKLSRDLSLSLGSSGVPMIEMIGAYGVVANGGNRADPFGVMEIRDENGNYLYRRMALSKQIFAPYLMRDLENMMRGVVEYGTGRGAALPFPAAGKTGTSQDHRDAWFIGFTDTYVAAVWLGNDDNSPMKAVTGGSLPARIWRDVMMAAHEEGYYGRRQRRDAFLSFASAFGDGARTAQAQPHDPRRTQEQDHGPSSFNSLLQRLFRD